MEKAAGSKKGKAAVGLPHLLLCENVFRHPAVPLPAVCPTELVARA